jgi:hypothetical protein
VVFSSRKNHLVHNSTTARELKNAQERSFMQVTVTISDDVVREAAFRGMNVIEFVESLIDKGLEAQARPALFSAIDRIRELRAATEPEEEKR